MTQNYLGGLELEVGPEGQNTGLMDYDELFLDWVIMSRFAKYQQ